MNGVVTLKHRNPQLFIVYKNQIAIIESGNAHKYHPEMKGALDVSPIDLVFLRTIRISDVFVLKYDTSISGRRTRASIGNTVLIIVEVISESSNEWDYITKPGEYAKRWIYQYMIVDHFEDPVTVFTLDANERRYKRQKVF